MLGAEGEDAELSNLKDRFWRDNTPFTPPQSPGERWRQEVAFGQDRQRTGLLSIAPIDETTERSGARVYSLVDITEQKDAQDKLEYLVAHDHLTGLPNRHSLDRQLRDLAGKPYVLLAIDLDRFRDVNDSYGHGAGDRVLQVVGERLEAFRKAHLGANDTLFNIGVDAFALIIHAVDQGALDQIAEGIQRAIEQTIGIDETLEVFTTATIGMSFQGRDQNSNALLEANTALYAAKRRKRGSTGVYEVGLSAESQMKMGLGLKLKKALANNELDVHYQPQFDTDNHRLRGVEALARWTDPEFGVVSPGDFIPVAEATGLIEALGEYVLERACQDGRQWLKDGHPPITISVNVSANQLRFGRFEAVLARIVERTGYPARQLEIEITESSYIEREEEVTPLLLRLKDMGVNVAIDDFGTGYSSLSYLREIPCDIIKIDRSFIIDIPHDPKQSNLTSAVIRLAKGMSFKVVVEGVETQEQLDFVTAQGCDFVQGYYFAPALPRTKLAALFATVDDAIY